MVSLVSLGNICKCKQLFCTLNNSFLHYLYKRLYETIITKLEKKSEKNEELELLWHEVKTSVKPLTAASCAKLITKITFNSKNLDPKDVLNSFLVYASHAQCPEGICWAVGHILWTLGSQNEFGIAKNQVDNILHTLHKSNYLLCLFI